jgi:dUTP pyrophosphatase
MAKNKVVKTDNHEGEGLKRALQADPGIVVLVKKLVPEATLPTRAEQDIPDAGWDLYLSAWDRVPAGGKKVVKTGIAMAIPDGWFGHIRPRSGVASTTPLMIDAGVIDPGYRGEIKIVLVNTADMPCEVEKGMKIAQMVFERIPQVTMQEVTDLPLSARDTKGFGSSGS